MKIFKTNKLEERKKLEEKGFQCKEVIGKDSVDFVFEVEEDVDVDKIINPEPIPAPAPVSAPASKKANKKANTKKKK